MRKCPNCGDPKRSGQFVCGDCWRTLPRHLRAAFHGAIGERAKRKACREINDWFWSQKRQCPHTTRYHLDRPFGIDDWTYATDGRIAVRTQMVLPAADGLERRYPNLRSLPWDRGAKWHKWPKQKWWRLDDGESDWCPYCAGLGLVGDDVVICWECGGAGEVCVDEDCIGRCPQCRGRKCAGGSRCHYCQGKGQGDFHRIQLIGRAWINGHYDLKVRTLPDVEFSEVTLARDFPPGHALHGEPPVDAVAIRFDGGEGVLMPLVQEGRLT
jgi:hypothetical protein